MAQYIPKDALVAEIDKRRNKHFNSGGSPSSEYCYEDDEILNIIDTLEVKEVQEGPVREEFEEASKEWLIPQLDKSYTNYGEAKMMELTHFDGYAMLDAIEFGAKWKEEQLEKNRLTACDAQTEEEAEIERNFVMSIIEKEHRQPTFDDAIKYGMRLQKEQMTAEVIDVEVKVDAGGYPYIDKTIELYDYDKDVPLAKAGEKVKVLVIKGD
jgi:hypothetical protein